MQSVGCTPAPRTESAPLPQSMRMRCREARFPIEAIGAMRKERLFSAMILREHGGDGLALTGVARLCEILAPLDTLTLEQRGTWDTLGMRGTCSQGYRVVAKGTAEQILPLRFRRSPMKACCRSRIRCGRRYGQALRAMR